MAKTKTETVENTLKINDLSEKQAKEFLMKGGTLKTVVTNYKADGTISSYCVTEKQIAPHYHYHLNAREDVEDDELTKLKKGVK